MASTPPGWLNERLACRLIGVLVLVFAGTAAAEATLPAKAQASVLARVLAYDNNLKKRAGDAVVVGVLYAAGSPPSSSEADEMFAAFKQLEKFVLLGLPMKAEKVAFLDAASLRAVVRDRGVDALFVCGGLDGSVSAVSAVARELQVITTTASRRYVADGLAIASVVVDNKPALVFNRQASIAEGSEFTSQFIALTTPVEKE